MYLKELILENVGAIDFIDLTLPFNDDGTAKPIVLVGVNGSGKTILLSYIADALIEFAKSAYSDIVTANLHNLNPYFKLSGGINQKNSSEFSIGLLEFYDKEQKYYYVDKTGKLNHQDYASKLKDKFAGINSWQSEGNQKYILPQDKSFFKKCFEQNSFCYFPPNRKEIPHWLNHESVNNPLKFRLEQQFSRKLNKPIYVESSLEENKAWILDVFLDSMFNFQLIQTQDQGLQPIFTDNLHDKKLLQISRINIEKLLQAILQNPYIRLAVNYRNQSNYRLCVATENIILIPSLDNLSSGQSILFNLFATIIRYSDKNDIHKSIRLEEIQGIVLIDEIDAHLHSNLQYEVLPKLLKLFPKVQFIVTTHSPLFILGMENEYGSNGFQLIEMPNGHEITTERFTEFKDSFEYYQKTKAFEDKVEEQVKLGTKPLVLTEGETDPIYIKTALELLGYNNILEQIDIEWVGVDTGKGKNLNSGDTGLNSTKNVFVANPKLLNRKLLLLYDCDTNKSDEDIGNLRVRQIKKREAAKAKKGIENLIPDELFQDQFYSKKTVEGDYGEKKQLSEFEKMQFCKWICEERKNPDDFVHFQVIIALLEDFLKKEFVSNK